MERDKRLRRRREQYRLRRNREIAKERQMRLEQQRNITVYYWCYNYMSQYNYFISGSPPDAVGIGLVIKN